VNIFEQMTAARSAPAKATPIGRSGWATVRWLPVVILISSAVFKSLSARTILASEGLLSSPIQLYFVIGFEIGCALFFLLSKPNYSWLASVLTFTVFGLVSAYAVSTAQSCHCFGPSISPKIMVLREMKCASQVK